MGKPPQVGTKTPGRPKGSVDAESHDSVARQRALVRRGFTAAAAARIEHEAELTRPNRPASIAANQADRDRKRLQRGEVDVPSTLTAAYESAKPCECSLPVYPNGNRVRTEFERGHSHCVVCEVAIRVGGTFCSKIECYQKAYWGTEKAAKAAKRASAAAVNQRGKYQPPGLRGRPRESVRQACTDPLCALPKNKHAPIGRDLSKMSLALNAPTPEDRAEHTRRALRILRACHVLTDVHLEFLGCTGLAHYGRTIEDSRFLRNALAGSGVGLTCFVPVDRYCAVHESLGAHDVKYPVPYGKHLPEISRPAVGGEKEQVPLLSAFAKRPASRGGKVG